MSSLHGRLNTYASSFIFYTVSLFFFKCLAVLHRFLTKMMMRALMVMLSRLDEISNLFMLELRYLVKKYKRYFKLQMWFYVASYCITKSKMSRVIFCFILFGFPETWRHKKAKKAFRNSIKQYPNTACFCLYAYTM